LAKANQIKLLRRGGWNHLGATLTASGRRLRSQSLFYRFGGRTQVVLAIEGQFRWPNRKNFITVSALIVLETISYFET